MSLNQRKQKKKLKKLSLVKENKMSHKEITQKRKLKSERLEYMFLVKEFSWLDELCAILEEEKE